MRQKYSRALIIVTVVLVVALAFLAFHLQNSLIPQILATDTPTPDVQATQFYTETVAAERTAIAIFTQNPTLALSSTPFYAEIIYHEILRRHTEVPNPRLTQYVLSLTASPTATLPSNSQVYRCGGPVLGNVALYELSEEIVELLRQRDIQADVFIVSVLVEGIDADCTIPSQAVGTQFQIGFRMEDSDDDNSLLIETTEDTIEFLLDYWERMDYVSKQGNILFYRSSQDSDVSDLLLETTYDAMEQAYEEGLRGDALIEALGGFVETN